VSNGRLVESKRPGIASTFAWVVRTYAREAGYLLAVGAAVFVPVGLIDSLGDRVGSVEVDQADDLTTLGLVGASLVQLATGMLGDVFYAGAVAALVKAERASAVSLRGVARRLPYGRLIAIDVLFSIGAGISLLLLIVPGIVFFTWYALAAPVAELEDRGVRASFSRSRSLVRGRFWLVLGLLVPLAIGTEMLTELGVYGLTHALGDSLLAEWLSDSSLSVGLAPFYALAAVRLALVLKPSKAAPEKA
jgi:hypothetical protein